MGRLPRGGHPVFALMAKKKKAKRRLEDLRIDHVALVDNPAVPKATHVIIKRRELVDDNEQIEDPREDSEAAEVEKDGHWLDVMKESDDWGTLPEHVQAVLQETAAEEEAVEAQDAVTRIMDAVDKAIRSLEMIDNPSGEVKTALEALKDVKGRYPAPKARHRHYPPPRYPRPYYPPPRYPRPKTEKRDLLEDAGALIKGRQEDKAAGALSGLSGRLQAALDKSTKLSSDLAVASGRAPEAKPNPNGGEKSG